MKKVKHIILTMIIIFNCLILSSLLFIIIIINKDNEKTKSVNIAEQNEMQTKAGEGTKYEIIDGKLYGWGWNDWGQLGQGTVEDISIMHEEPMLIANSVVHVDTCNNGTTVFLNNKGQLGDGPAESNVEGHYIYGYTPFSYEPKHIMGGVSYIACGGCTIGAIKNNGELWMWGDNTYGQVGNKIAGPNGASTTNFSVTKPYLTMEQVKNVRFEGDFETTVFAETLSGETYVWGEGYSAVPSKVEE